MKKYRLDLPLFSLHIPKAAGTSLTSVLEQWYNQGSAFNVDNHPRLYKLLTFRRLDFYMQRFKKNGFWRHYKNHQFNTLPRKAPLGKGYGCFLNKPVPECVHGHFDPLTDEGNLFDYYPKAQQFIMFLRDPLRLQISLYEYNAAQGRKEGLYWQGKRVESSLPFDMTLDDFVAKGKSYMLRFLPWELTEENYKSIIEDNFVFIGIVERMEESLVSLAKTLGFEYSRMPNENKTQYSSQLSDNAISSFKANNRLEYMVYDFANRLLDQK